MREEGQSSEVLAYSVRDFCDAVGISLRTFYTLKKKGSAPPVVKIGRRVFIRASVAKEWLCGHEMKD